VPEVVLLALHDRRLALRVAVTQIRAAISGASCLHHLGVSEARQHVAHDEFKGSAARLGVSVTYPCSRPTICAAWMPSDRPSKCRL
jgi:hypothetical protein